MRGRIGNDAAFSMFRRANSARCNAVIATADLAENAIQSGLADFRALAASRDHKSFFN
jgi:hypothetical protein